MNEMAGTQISEDMSEGGRIELMKGLGVLEALLPAAKSAAQLRACGFLVVATPCALEALEAIGGEDAEWIAASVWLNDKGIIKGRWKPASEPAKRLRARWWQFWKRS